jgi:hypothetical protein
MKVSTSLTGIGFAKKYPCILRTTEAVDDLDLLCRFQTFDHAESQVAASVNQRLDDVVGVFCFAILRMKPHRS